LEAWGCLRWGAEEDGWERGECKTATGPVAANSKNPQQEGLGGGGGAERNEFGGNLRAKRGGVSKQGSKIGMALASKKSQKGFPP